MEPHAPTGRHTDLDAAFSHAGIANPWTPDLAPYSSWSHSTSRSQPTSTASITEQDLSRRLLAANGLDVSAPEFVPSFAKRKQPPVPNHQHQQPQHPSLASSPEYAYGLSPPQSLYHDNTFSHTPHTASPPHIQPYFNDPLAYQPLVEESTYYAASPPQRPHLDSMYVNAVQHFEEEFPALAKPLQEDHILAHLADPAMSNPSHWSPERVGLSPTESSPPPAQLALGWDALQREEARKRRLADEATKWQSSLDDYEIDSRADLSDLDPDKPRLSNDVGSLWVSTGQSVGQLYQSLRAEAAEEARLRNKYFDRATAAFKRNDGATAKRLGALGREANERMKELHRRAAEAIFEARNPPHVKDVLDLHGLHVSEALERLPQALEKAPIGTLRILTGTGHHTKGTGRARLRPAVKKWLVDNGYIFEEVVDANEYVGSFKVEITR